MTAFLPPQAVVMLAIIFVLLPVIACHMRLGGLLTVDVNSTHIQKLATFAVGELNSLLGSPYRLVKVVSAETQVVAGTNYILSLQLQDNDVTKTCNVTVWSRPWLIERRLQHHWCSANKRDASRRSSVSVDTHRADVQAMVSFALAEMNKQNKTHYGLHNTGTAFVDVSGVSTIEYFLKFRVTDGPNFRWCQATVRYSPSTSTKTMTDDKCYFAFKLLSTDVNSDGVRNAAKFAVNQINGVDETQFKLDEIVSAKMPDVLSFTFENYYLVLRLSENGQTKLCQVRIVETLTTNSYSMSERDCSKLS